MAKLMHRWSPPHVCMMCQLSTYLLYTIHEVLQIRPWGIPAAVSKSVVNHAQVLVEQMKSKPPMQQVGQDMQLTDDIHKSYHLKQRNCAMHTMCTCMSVCVYIRA